MYNIPQEYAARFAPGALTLLKLAHGQEVYSLASVRLTSPVCAAGLTIGAVSAAGVEAKVEGLVDLAGETVTLTIETPDGAASLPLGTFVVSESKAGEQLTTITAYDAALWALDGAYVPSVSSPPATALAVLADLCAQCALSLGSTSGLTDVSISGTLTGHSCREMAGCMAALLGCNVVIDRTGALCLRRFADHGQTVTPEIYYAGGLRLDAPITLAGVRMRKTTTTITTDSDGIRQESTSTATYEAGSGSGLVIEVDNPFATQAIVDAVWTALHGAVTTFRTGSCSYFGGLTVEPGDLLTITDTDNQSCVFPVMSAVLELDGGCKATVSGTGAAETAIAPNLKGPVGRQLSKLEADLGAFKELTADNFTAAVAKVNTLYADEAWVRNLFAQSLEAQNLRVYGESTFEGVLNAKYGRAGGVEIGRLRPAYTRSEEYTIDDDDEQLWVETSDSPGAPVAEQQRLAKIGVWVTKPGATGTANFKITLYQDNPYVVESFDTSNIRYNEDEVFFPVLSDSFDINKSIDWGGYTSGGMGGATVHTRMYYGDHNVIVAESDIYTDTRFVEGGVPLEQKYLLASAFRHTLTVTATTQSGVTVTGQTVTVRAGGATGEVFATAAYSGQPVAFALPVGFSYHVSITEQYGYTGATTATGIVTDADCAATLIYSSFAPTGPDLKAILNAGGDLTSFVGEQITCAKGSGTLTWDIVDYDSTAKTVTLLLHDLLPDTLAFEPPQALAYFETGLAAGRYKFTQDGTTYYFTTTLQIPYYGQLVADASSFTTYAPYNNTMAVRETGTVSTTAISGAINLGTTGTGNLNHHDRVANGSNNYGESGIRQWLNSDAAANTPLPRINRFSRPYSVNVAGFLNGLDADFVAALDNTVWKCSANNGYEAPAAMGGICVKSGTYTVTDKIALASEMEIFGSYSGVADGSTQWDLFAGASASDRVKYDSGTARDWWLRSPVWYYSSGGRAVNASGSAVGRYSGNNTLTRVVPACKISKDA